MNWVDRIKELREQSYEESYDPNNPHNYKHPELGYIEIMAKKGRAKAAKDQDSEAFDKFQHILDNVKILVDKVG